MTERVIVAKIGAAHGVRGEVKLWPFTQDPMAVADYGPLETKDGARRFEIETVRAAGNHLVARLKGVADRDAAQTLTNIELYVPRDRLPAIDEDHTYYHSDLVGLDAIGEDGAQIGTVHAVHDFGAGSVLEITPLGSGETLMLPFTEITVPKVDLAAKQVVIVPPAEIEAREE
ncbi:MAG TPA: ribosome maturation factor RimM [Pseudolabrys sp.]|jgi:16S rRNA processing protein RimM|nr:ribosome maturation factor RimM [Pseudolabrys sp.]